MQRDDKMTAGDVKKYIEYHDKYVKDGDFTSALNMLGHIIMRHPDEAMKKHFLDQLKAETIKFAPMQGHSITPTDAVISIRNGDGSTKPATIADEKVKLTALTNYLKDAKKDDIHVDAFKKFMKDVGEQSINELKDKMVTHLKAQYKSKPEELNKILQKKDSPFVTWLSTPTSRVDRMIGKEAKQMSELRAFASTPPPSQKVTATTPTASRASPTDSQPPLQRVQASVSAPSQKASAAPTAQGRGGGIVGAKQRADIGRPLVSAGANIISNHANRNTATAPNPSQKNPAKR